MEHLERYRPIVDDFDGFVRACRRPLPTTVRVHETSAGVDRVRRAYRAAGVEAEPLAWDRRILRLGTDAPGRTLPAFLGWVHGQEAASCLPAPLLAVEPGDRVWDACAAPGSKTGHIVDLLGDEGLLLATDDNLGRLSALRFNTERLGATCVAVEHADARHASFDAVGGAPFDAALVDAPCSGEGTIRRKSTPPEGPSPDHIETLAGVQRSILDRALAATRPGGRVVYSTCTFAPEENEAVVDAVLADRDCTVLDVDLPIPTAQGVTDWRGASYDPAVTRAHRVYPHLADTGGFFIAALEVGS